MRNSVIKNPRVTEKGSTALERNVYIFDVAEAANKKEIAEAIFAIYKVKPGRINISKVPRKKNRFRGLEGTKGGGKKAFVYLKAGDKIEFI